MDKHRYLAFWSKTIPMCFHFQRHVKWIDWIFTLFELFWYGVVVEEYFYWEHRNLKRGCLRSSRFDSSHSRTANVERSQSAIVRRFYSCRDVSNLYGRLTIDNGKPWSSWNRPLQLGWRYDQREFSADSDQLAGKHVSELYRVRLDNERRF